MMIVIDCRMYRASGIGRYLQEIVPSIIQGLNVSKVVLLGKKKELEEDFGGCNNVEFIDFLAPIYSIKEQLQYRRIIPKCDLFWSPHFNIPIFPIKAKKRLVTIHDAYHLAFSDQLSKKENIYAKILYKLALKQSDQVITVSKFSKSELIKYTEFNNPKKIEVIYNGVKAISDTIDYEINEDYNLYLLFVGNVKPHKNLKAALLGFDAYLNKLKNDTYKKNLDFLIVGKKDGFINGDQEIAELVNNNLNLKDRVKFTGFVSDEKLAGLYKNAYAFIFPSIYEGFGFPPLEAMYYDCPVLCSDQACMPEICNDSVLYFSPTNINSIANSISEIQNDTSIRDGLIVKGQERIKHFNWNDSIGKHIKLIKDLIQQ